MKEFEKAEELVADGGVCNLDDALESMGIDYEKRLKDYYLWLWEQP